MWSMIESCSWLVLLHFKFTVLSDEWCAEKNIVYMPYTCVFPGKDSGFLHLKKQKNFKAISTLEEQLCPAPHYKHCPFLNLLQNLNMLAQNILLCVSLREGRGK